MNNQDEINKCRRIVKDRAMKDAIQQLYNTCLDVAYSEPHYSYSIELLKSAIDQDGVPTPKMFEVLLSMSYQYKIRELAAKLAAE